MTLLSWLTIAPAQAATTDPHRGEPQVARPAGKLVVATGTSTKRKPTFAKARVALGRGLQCVPFARNSSGIILSGNAHLWWGNAEGVYARGQAPEAGSVLSFDANRSMTLGHVAVVSRVINDRQLEIDHANWAGPGGRKGSVARGVVVVDVSDNNDWTAVRVALGHTGNYGSVYPTNGFIYERPANGGAMMAQAPAEKIRAAVAPVPEMNDPPRDLRPDALDGTGRNPGGYGSVMFVGGTYEEAAEAPAAAPRRALRRKPVQIRH
ncbi:MAG: CHAP domain-containing protein [Acetobacteraceae bacterium]|nr:CHAP domain-containing protein [Acetobacteraceae bacterium]